MSRYISNEPFQHNFKTFYFVFLLAFFTSMSDADILITLSNWVMLIIIILFGLDMHNHRENHNEWRLSMLRHIQKSLCDKETPIYSYDLRELSVCTESWSASLYFNSLSDRRQCALFIIGLLVIGRLFSDTSVYTY